MILKLKHQMEVFNNYNLLTPSILSTCNNNYEQYFYYKSFSALYGAATNNNIIMSINIINKKLCDFIIFMLQKCVNYIIIIICIGP